VIGAEVDFRALKSAPGGDVLPYLYHGPAARAAVEGRLARHPGTVKAKSYADKLLVLAPKRPGAYLTLVAFADYARDTAALRAVVAQVRGVELDLGDAKREMQEYLSGKADAKKVEDLRKRLARAEAALAAARPLKGPTFAVAVGRYVHAKLDGWPLGEPVDADELVRLAEEAHAAAPSDGTEALLRSALLHRAHVTLMKADDGYKARADRTKRSVGSHLIYHVLATDGPERAKVAANPDVKRLAALQSDAFRRDPSNAGPATWLLVRAVTPAGAAEVAERVKGNERARLHRELARLVTPDSAAAVLEEVWVLMLEGKKTDADKLLADLKAHGVPVP